VVWMSCYYPQCWWPVDFIVGDSVRNGGEGEGVRNVLVNSLISKRNDVKFLVPCNFIA
jgi:hypothetical protein